ncbi:SprT family zinc-dependent metalloprotease [Parolsenella catena]|uniref:M48 family metallopeptidase n=1 Tax=Parolsenella catena TaxID=2003188 RepID=UPI00307896BB
MDGTSYTLYVRCGDERLGAVPVCVTRKRVRNLNLRKRRHGSVVASVPWRTSRARVQEFLDAHAGWIAKRVSRKAERQAESREAVPSPAYALWGCEHRTADGHTPTAAELDELWRREVERALPGVIARMEPLVGAHASSWQLRAMSSRWGSCTPAHGSIRINVRLAAYPPECLDYVVAHELAHLIEPSHNARFHAIVARAIGNERAIRARLRQPPATA